MLRFKRFNSINNKKLGGLHIERLFIMIFNSEEIGCSIVVKLSGRSATFDDERLDQPKVAQLN